LRVIGENDEQLGVMTRQAALERAKLAGLDLVEVSPNAVPPVVKIVDWGKYSYQKAKQQKKSKSHDLKQIRMGLKIGEHDLDVKIKKIEGFLEAGHMVKVSAFFRGREMAHKDIGYTLLERVMEKLGEDKAVIEQQPQMTGKNLSMTIRKK
jgi:translation initiation factor IF-3